MKANPPSILQRMDPLLDPVIFYLILSGPLKVMLYSIVAAVDPDLLVFPIIGPVWFGFDENVLACLLSYTISAVILLSLRNGSRGRHMSSKSTPKSARRLTFFIVLIAFGSIVEQYIAESGYISVLFLPVFLGWISLSTGKIHTYVIVIVCLLSFAATRSKWVLIALPLAFSGSGLILLLPAILVVYPFLNQVRFFLMAMQLGYGTIDSISMLNIPDLNILNSLVALFSRAVSFESTYLLQSAGISTFNNDNFSFYNMSRYVSYDILDLNYGLSVSFYSQMVFVFDSPVMAGLTIVIACIFYGVFSGVVMRFAPAAALVIGLIYALTLSDGFNINRQKYLIAGLVLYFIIYVFSNYRARLQSTSAPQPYKN